MLKWHANNQVKGLSWCPAFLLWFLFFTSSVSAQEKITVFVSIVPQQYFVQQISNNLVNVQVMVPPGASPETYEPKPAQMAALEQTKIYFSIGVPFENVWLKKITAINPELRIINTDSGIEKRLLEKLTHDHEPPLAVDRQKQSKEPHSGEIPDPHIWLSPPLVMMQARLILLGLQEVDPDRRDIYAQNYLSFLMKLVELDDKLRSILADARGKRFLVFHPAWGYFADAYGLIQIPVEVEGKSPKPAQLQKVVEYARQHALNIIFAQPQHAERNAEQVARAINGQVILADPLALDWEHNLIEAAIKIKNALK